MSLKIQAVSREKINWAEGLLVIIDRNGSWLGGEQVAAQATELEATVRQFKEAPAVELTGFTAGKKPRAALFLSNRQVKYYSDSDKMRTMASRALRTARKLKLDKLILPLESASLEEVEALLHGLHAAAYSYKKYKSKVDDQKDIAVTIGVEKSQLKSVQSLLNEQEVLNSGVSLARDLVNEIPAELYPERLAEAARIMASDTGLKVTIYDEKRLAKERFNGVLTVGRGSNHPPRLMIMKHTPARKSKIHLALVGKAVTFDTGGHSLKQPKGMWEMKGDMAGGAAVIGAMQVIGNLRPDIEITGIVASALNAIGPEAMLPGDIIRSRSGKTVHVDNTDAEGRLLLMDCLDYAQEIGATHIVDLATLTGAIVRALGEAYAGLFCNDDNFAEQVRSAGSAVGEGYWRMPLVPEYREQLDHPLADIDNVGKSVNAGAITAALFLQEFVEDSVKWAHLDIAAVGLITKNYKHLAAGGTGFGVRTLVELSKSLSKGR